MHDRNRINKYFATDSPYIEHTVSILVVGNGWFWDRAAERHDRLPIWGAAPAWGIP